MKRCPECRRDYYDDTLLYCLDDGSALLEGPALADEPATAILSEPRAAAAGLQRGEAPTILDSVGPGAATDNSIAVLPFVNISADVENEYFCDGLAEELLNALTRVEGLRVAARTSSFFFKGKNLNVTQIGNALGVRTILEGTVRKSGDRLKITVQLVNVANGFHLWSERYDRQLKDIFEVQDEITLAIVDSLKLKLLGRRLAKALRRHTANAVAYSLYLKGRFHFARRTKDEINKSIHFFQQAIRLDPRFALAYAGVAESYAVMSSFPYMSPTDAAPKAKAALAKSLEIDPELAEAYTLAGTISSTYDWDWQKAEREFKHALELDPDLAVTHYRYGWVYLSPIGRHDEAVAEMQRAMELEPLSLIQGASYAGALMYAKRFDDALEQAKNTYDLDPAHIGARAWLTHTYNAKGMYAESLEITDPTAIDSSNPMLAQGILAFARAGRRQEAEAIIARLHSAEKDTYVMNYWIAVTYAALGEKDAAFGELEKAYQQRDWFLPRLKTDPFMEPLRGDPRYKDMLNRVNLPE